MNSDDRIFADDWRDCLREQYKYVIRQGDKRTEETLTNALHGVGFDDDELRALKLEATIRADDMPDDYVPDEVKSSYAGVDVKAEEMVTDEPAEEPIVEAVIEADEEPEPEPVTYDELIDQVDGTLADEDLDVDPEPEDDEDAPQQMSLF